MSFSFDPPLFHTYGIRVVTPPSLLGLGIRRGKNLRNRWRMRVAYPDGLCSYCGERKPLTADHVEARSRGGPDLLANKVPACSPCNLEKGDKSLLMFLLGRR